MSIGRPDIAVMIPASFRSERINSPTFDFAAKAGLGGNQRELCLAVDGDRMTGTFSSPGYGTIVSAAFEGVLRQQLAVDWKDDLGRASRGGLRSIL